MPDDDRPPPPAGPYGATDFAKVDAHVIAPEEYEELPELTDEQLASGELHEGGRLIRRGRGRANQ